MRTKEKFYENLKNNHVSLEKRIERFEFKDVKTLDALVTEANSLVPKIKNVFKEYTKAHDQVEIWKTAMKDAYKAKDEALKEADRLDKVIENNKKRQKEGMDNAYARLDSTKEHQDDAVKEMQETEVQLNSLNGYGEQLIDEMENNINKFESSASAMGVSDKVSSLVSKYKNTVSKIKDVL